MTPRNCCICTNISESLKSLNCENDGTIKLSSKLELVAPEYKWADIFSICPKCITLLDNAYYFKQLCLASASYRENFNNDTTELAVHKTDLDVILDTRSDNETDLVEVEPTFSRFDDTNTDSSNCGEKFKSEHSLKCHISKKHTTIKCQEKGKKSFKKFQCDFCGQHFALLKNIFEHCISVHDVKREDIKPYRCNQCNNKFPSSSALIQHKKYHNSERTFVCTICGKSFKTGSDLNGHVKHHGNNRKYSCNKCDKKFKTSQNLKTHIYVIHTDPTKWKYSCPVCSKRFAMKTNYNEHIKRHQGAKHFVCHICQKSFVSNHEVKKHVKLHLNISLFECTYCQKHYRDKRSLASHLFVHGIGGEKVKPKKLT